MPSKTNKPVAEALKPVLANTYLIYLKTQNFHWNVTGPRFRSLHLMFEEQYTQFAAAIDEIAERIRALGEKAPGTVKSYLEDASIKEGDENATAAQMVKALRDDNQTLVKVLKKALKVAQDHEDEVTADLIIGRITEHEKTAWMLDASME